MHKLDNVDKALNKDVQTNNETEFLYASHIMQKILSTENKRSYIHENTLWLRFLKGMHRMKDS